MGWLEGYSALITGGTGGIGSAIVRRYVAEGANVTVLANNATELAALQEELGDRIATVCGDVTAYEDNARAVEVALANFGKLDVFVANAALFDYFTRLDKIPPEEFERHFQKLFAVNVQGYLLGAQAAIPALRESKGSIIFTLSNSAFYAGGGGILYVASKHAIVGVVRQLAYELAPHIRVNGVAPGATDTPMATLTDLNEKSVPLNQLPNFAENAASAVPLQKIADPDAHTGHYVLLASRENSALTTATIIHSDGGWEVRKPGIHNRR
ncbi:3-(cis-5,6-dihydroxycyclohexa-1,3-dien-1-yl)propanoate dehydrogenase [Ignatzschineria sp. F8392]|uniref:3-(cis-5,6-dihydroxycyclohexa-1, 3-dien-1-yl)propanoate dehydrogenase n=1 Tax=Ignatzschineria sp. F8392 TaxID=1980117 RepID=UPI000B9898A8|nr:3-(cis-5,6-dihydroxycyclohexa-1,3-dien-1-yl)propanoate dehydrogenase [Ignatzschineria sp. F8392]OYQ78059.1 3-(cis-5,6-dihydroxycyclohexa-1,3-dien-1-yl)propanoate dehydrogenase [Ignatzschineria sp. F8392]